MVENSGSKGSGRKKDHGPQGTQVFSGDQVADLLAEVEQGDPDSSSPVLRGVSDGIQNRTLPLASDRVVIGRAAQCDLVLNDQSVSSQHARIFRDASGWQIMNMLSTNGTFVNDKKVSSSALKAGDRIRMGRLEFVFDPGQDQAKSPSVKTSRDSKSTSSRPLLPWVVVALLVVIIILLLR